MLALQVAVVVALVLVSLGLALFDALARTRGSAFDRTLAIATSVADSPLTREAVSARPPVLAPTSPIQAYAHM